MALKMSRLTVTFAEIIELYMGSCLYANEIVTNYLADFYLFDHREF